MLKKVTMMKDWKSTSKKTFKEPAANSETKRESKKKPTTATKEIKESKEIKDLALLSKNLSNRLFGTGVVVDRKIQKKTEKKKESTIKSSLNSDNISGKKVSKIC